MPIPLFPEELGCLLLKEIDDFFHWDAGGGSSCDDCTCARSGDEVEALLEWCMKSAFNVGQELRGIYPAGAAAIKREDMKGSFRVGH